MIFEMGIHHSLRSWHLNKPHSFTPAPVRQVWLSSQQAVDCAFLFLFTIFVYFIETMWASVSPKGPRLGSQLPATGCPKSKQDCGASQQLPRTLLGEFPCIPSQDFNPLKCLSGERKWVSWEQLVPETTYLNQHAHWGSSIPTAWSFCTTRALCHLGFVPPESG